MQQNFMQLTGVDLIVPVDGIEGAKAYPLGPSCRAPLFDKNNDIFYIKSTDANGFPTIKQYKFEEEVLVDIQNTGNGVALDDIRSLIREELSSIKEELLNGQQSIPATNSETTNRNESGIASINKHNGKPSNAGPVPTKPKQGSNSSVVEHGKEQQ